MGADTEAVANTMRIGIRRLLDQHPLLGGLVAQWRVQASDIGTMGVCWEGDRITLLYDPRFVRAITRDQLVNVLMHEVRHVVYGHCFMDPADWPDRDALVIAQEVTVNEGLHDLPGQPILLGDHPELPPDTDTRERYAILARPGRPAGMAHASLDDHGGWRLIRGNQSQATATITSAIDRILAEVPDLKADAVELDRILDRFPGIGSRPGQHERRIHAQARDISISDLQRIVESHQGWARARGYRFDRPARRAPHLLGIVPASALVRRKAQALAVVDTSGSIDERTLASISAILIRLEDAVAWTVVECDAAIHRVYPFQGSLNVVQGRGGTNFRPPLESDFLAERQTDLVVYFTDGYGPAPRHPPQVDVVWALTKNGVAPAPWGLVLRVET